MAIWRIPHKRRPVYKFPVVLFPAEAVTDTLTVADGVCANAGDVLDLIQEHNLSLSDGAVATVGEVVTLSQTGVTTLTQHSFRFRNNDGDEDEATWAAALNNAYSIAPDSAFRLRFLIDAQGDNDGKQFRLEYKKSTDVDWLIAA